MTANINNSQARISDLIEITNQQIKEDNFQDPKNQQKEDQKNNDKIIYILICVATFAAIAAIILGITLGLLLNKRKTEPEPNPQPTPYMYSCLDFPTDCQGVQPSLQTYIFQSSSNPDQIKAQLQIGRSFSGIQTNTRINLTDVYKQVVRSVQCLAYTMPNTFSQAYFALAQLQFQTEQSLIDYLNMTYSFSGQTLILTPSTEVSSNCQFNVSSTTATRVRNLQSGCGASATSVLLYFDGNGYSPISSFRNLQTITQLFQQNSSVSFDGGAIYVGSYRIDGSTDFFSNLLTGFQQSLQQNSQQVPSRLSLLQCLRIITDGAPMNVGLPSNVTQQVMDQLYNYLSLQTILSMNNIQTNYYADWHKQFVGKQIKAGKKVVLVSHAQGAIYANSIYNLLSADEKSSVGLVYTAPFASSMADGLINYLSNPADVVLTALTGLATATSAFSVPLSPNMHSSTFNRSFDAGYNHDFQGYVQSYLTQFSQLIISAKNRITQPSTIFGNGPIKVQLTWDSQPDVDMHVLEPNNVHVYWSNRNGIVGTLQLDATSGYGPQYYYTRCQSMIAGEYIVSVNYYSGSGPSTMTMTVQAGTEYFVRTMVLPSPMGGSGDSNPTPVCKIVGTLVNPNTGYYTFQITQL